MIPRPTFLFLFCAGFPWLSAAGGIATAAEVSAKAANGPVFTVLAAGSRPLPEELHYLKSPDEGILLATSPARRSAPLSAPAGAALVFGIPRPKPAPGESGFVSLFSVNWPAGATERVLVLLASDGARLNGVAIDDGERVFPPGTLRMVNLLNRPLAARWGDFTAEFPPGPSVAHPYPSMPPGAGGQPNRFRIMLGTTRADGNGTTLIYAGRVEARANARTLVVVREVKETDVTEDGEVMDAGVSYNVRWVVDSRPPRDKTAP